jgi:hypothetical protein
MAKLRGWTFFLLLLLTVPGKGQNGALIFNDSAIHEIRVTFYIPNWFDSLTAGYEEGLPDIFDLIPERKFPCKVVFDGNLIDSSGMRMRGNYSNQATPLTNANGLKRPFKIDFDAFRNQSFDGIKSFNLNNGTDDPSFVREALVYKFIRDLGLPASRTSFARLYINEVYWGLYEIVENVDKTFLKHHYGGANNDGNLYKTNRQAAVSLKWEGNSYQPYQNQGLILKTNRQANDWTRLIEFIDVINNTPVAQMESRLGAIFDVESYLKILAVEVTCYSWDSYWGIGNNFYIYEHPDGKLRWIPWDFNETFSTKEGLIGFILPDQSDVFCSSRFNERPLLKAVFSVKKWQDMYLDFLCEFATQTYSAAKVSPGLIAWQNQIRPWLEADTNKLATMYQFNRSLTTDINNLYQVPETGLSFNVKIPGLLPFITRQREWVVKDMKKQKSGCPLSDITPRSYPLTLYPNPSSGPITLAWDREATPIFRYEILNPLGQKVWESFWITHPGQSHTLTPEIREPGLYFIKKTDADGFWAFGKFILQ